MTALVYDTGMLLAVERGRRDARVLHERALARGADALVPAAVLAQAWRGGPQPNLSRLLVGCEVIPLDAALARTVGSLLALAGTSDVVDGSVVVVAAVAGAGVVTSDHDDIVHLASAGSASIPVEEI